MLTKKGVILFLIIILPLFLLLAIIKFERFLPLPIVVRRTIHTFFPEKDFYKPVFIDDEFLLTQEGFSKEYLLDIKYYDFYRLGLVSTKGDIPAKYEFKGLIKLEFFCNNELIFSHNISSASRKCFAGKDLGRLERIDLFEFPFPIAGKYKKDVKMKLTVLKQDLELLPYMDSIQISVEPYGLFY